MDLHGLAMRRLYVLLFIEHDTRSVHLAGITAYPSGEWVTHRREADSFGRASMNRGMTTLPDLAS
jgi:hypothetical protein